jgi:holin-like protein
MLSALTLLLVLQLVGEAIVVYFDFPVPGPVLGMLLLLGILFLHGGVSPSLSQVAQGLLQRLSMLFVPAGVGVTTHLVLIKDAWQAIGLAVVISTLLGIIITAAVMTVLTRARKHDDG